MMRGAAFRPLLRMRPQIMWGGAAGVGAASGGSRRRCFTGCSLAVESARGAGVREGVLGADFRPFGKRWANVRYRTTFWKWSAK